LVFRSVKSDMRTLQFYITLMLMSLAFCSVNSLSAQGSSPTPSPNEIFKNAFSAFQQGNYDLAIKNYNLAITADPTRNYFYYNRALTYKAMGNVPKAMDDLTTSLSYKQTAEAYYQIGLIKYEKNDLEGAKVEFENAKLIKNDIERMNFFLGMIYFRNNRYDEAIKCFYDYTSVVKNYADAYYYRGLAEAKLGSYQDAITSFKFAQMYKNSDWKLYYKMYEIYLAMNDKENALYSLSMVIELGEKKPEHYEERARLFLDNNNTFKYEEDIRIAKELRASVASAK
jgi:tetratricopeptide (TPR) repeat protein